MEITVGLVCLLFGLHVPAIYWILSIFNSFLIGMYNKCHKEERLPTTNLSLYLLFFIFNANQETFARLGYHQIDWIYSLTTVLFWIGIVLISCYIAAKVSKEV